MQNRYIFQFQKLHNHELPSWFEAEFDWFVTTCHDVLSSRSDAEIEEIVIAIDRHVIADKAWLFDTEAFEKLDEEDFGLGAGLYPSRFHAVTIVQLMDAGDPPYEAIKELSAFKGLTWKECLAAALLSTSLFAITQEQFYRSSPFEDSELGQFFESLEGLVGQHAINGMELLTMIRALSGFNSYPKPKSEIVKELKSEHGKRGSAKRWGPSTALKDKFVEVYKKHPDLYPSKTAWAEKYLESLSEDERKELGVDPTRNLLGHLRKSN